MPIDSRAVAEAPGGGQKDCVTDSVTCERSGPVRSGPVRSVGRSVGRTHISRMHTNRQPAVATSVIMVIIISGGGGEAAAAAGCAAARFRAAKAARSAAFALAAARPRRGCFDVS